MENGLKYGPKTSKNHENSKFDKSADMADINVLQVRECDYRLIKDFFNEWDAWYTYFGQKLIF